MHLSQRLFFRFFASIICCGLLSLPLSGQDSSTDTIPEAATPALRFSEANISFSSPGVMRVGKNIPVKIEVSGDAASLSQLEISVSRKTQTVSLVKGQATLEVPTDMNTHEITLQVGDYQKKLETAIVKFPPWLSILPPLIAILLALLFREVIVSLFTGIFFGAAVLGYYNQDSLVGIFKGFLTVVDTYIRNALTDADHMAIVLFSMLIGGMVAVISRNGGMQGIVNHISRFARTARSGQFATWLLGLVIFFDDYANTLVVGNTMRSITDKLKISREKLSYIVDSTAAPVAALAFITTWIGAELGYIEDGIAGLSDFPEGLNPYSIFLSSLKYSFYPILTLIFILILIYTGRDFGPMFQAESRARSTGEVSRDGKDAAESDELKHFQPLPGIRIRAVNAVIPVMVLIFGVLTGLLSTGYDPEIWGNQEVGFFKKLSMTIGNSDSYSALMWASISAVVVAIGMTIGQRVMKITQAVETVNHGFKAMLGAILILIMAWALQGVTGDMHTAGFLTDLLGSSLQPEWIPAITFVLGAIVSFSTGSSWGTMAILYPLLIPLGWKVCLQHGLSPDEALPLLYNLIACNLAGSVLGDHCSPISDTTILSSLACSCNHIDHVRTQLPYALVVGGISIIFGTLPTAYGIPAWVCFPLAIAVMFGTIRLLGKPVDPVT